MAPSRLLRLVPILLLWGCGPRVGPDGAWPSLAGGRPAPVTDLLGDSWTEDNGVERKRWIAGMHRAGAGVDWRAIERANAKAERVRRTALAALDSPEPGTWEEIGSRNLAGHTRCAALGPPRADGSRRLYVGSANGGLWRAETGGRDWRPMSDSLFGGVDEVVVLAGETAAAAPVIVMRRGRELFRSDDEGSTWSMPEGTAGLVDARRMALLADGVGTILLLADRAGADGVIHTELLASTDRGRSFASRWVAGAAWAGDMWVPSVGSAAATDVWVLHGGCVLRSTDGGRTFGPRTVIRPDSTAGMLDGSEAGAPALYVAVEASGTWCLYGSHDGGGTFLFRSALEDFWGVMGAFPSDPDAFVYGGVEAHRSSDGGRTFQRVNAWGQYYGDPAHRLHADVRGIDVLPDPDVPGRDLCYVSTDGGTYLSVDACRTVTNLSLDGMGVGQIYCTHTSSRDPDLILAGSQDQGYQRGRRRPPQGSGPSTPFDQLLSGDYGYLSSSDGSHELVYSSYPGFVLVQEGEEEANLLYPWIDFPDGADHAWLPAVVADPTDRDSFFFLADRLYRYTRREGPFWSWAVHSEEDFAAGGASFLTALAFAPSEPSRVYAANDAGAVWLSEDGGQRWRASAPLGAAAFYPTTLVVDPDEPWRAVAAGSGYSNPSVFLTDDGGATWRPAAEGLPPTIVLDVAFAGEGGNDLYAATEAGAYRLRAGQSGWENVMGLTAPATTYWSVEHVPAAGVLRFGTYGRGIWDFRPRVEVPDAEAR